MNATHAVMRAEDPNRAELQARGWRLVARSWAAQLNAAAVDRAHLHRLIRRVEPVGIVRELQAGDAPAVLALDRATIDDYPGGVATTHEPLSFEQATVGSQRRGFGVIGDGELMAMTFLDVDGCHAETDFTVVRQPCRGLGLGAAVKAAAVLALLDDGIGRFRTGGSADNAASLGANRSVGFVIDEEWVTLAPPD